MAAGQIRARDPLVLRAELPTSKPGPADSASQLGKCELPDATSIERRVAPFAIRSRLRGIKLTISFEHVLGAR